MNCIVCTLYCVDYFTEHNLRVIHFVVCIHNAFVFNLILSQFHFYTSVSAAAAVKSLQSCPTLCNPRDSSPPGSPSLGFSKQEHWNGLPIPSPTSAARLLQYFQFGAISKKSCYEVFGQIVFSFLE